MPFDCLIYAGGYTSMEVPSPAFAGALELQTSWEKCQLRAVEVGEAKAYCAGRRRYAKEVTVLFRHSDAFGHEVL